MNSRKPATPVKIASSLVLILLLLVLFFLSAIGCDQFGASENEFDLHYKVYVPNLSANSITVIPPLNSTETTTIDINRPIQQIALVPGTDTVFTLLSGTNEIILVNSEDDTIGDTIRFEVGSSTPQANNRVIFNPGGTKAFFATSFIQAGVAVMSVADYSLENSINVQSTSVTRFFFSSDGGRLYAIDPQMDAIYEIDPSTDQLLQTVQVVVPFDDALFDPASSTFYLLAGTSIKEYDLASDTVDRQVDNVTASPVEMILSHDGASLYVVGSTEIATVDLASFSLGTTYPLEYQSPSDFQYLPDNSYVLVPSTTSSLLMLLSPTDFSSQNTIDTGANPGEMIIFPERTESPDATPSPSPSS